MVKFKASNIATGSERENFAELKIAGIHLTDWMMWAYNIIVGISYILVHCLPIIPDFILSIAPSNPRGTSTDLSKLFN